MRCAAACLLAAPHCRRVALFIAAYRSLHVQATQRLRRLSAAVLHAAGGGASSCRLIGALSVSLPDTYAFCAALCCCCCAGAGAGRAGAGDFTNYGRQMNKSSDQPRLLYHRSRYLIDQSPAELAAIACCGAGRRKGALMVLVVTKRQVFNALSHSTLRTPNHARNQPTNRARLASCDSGAWRQQQQQQAKHARQRRSIRSIIIFAYPGRGSHCRRSTGARTAR